MKIPGFTSMYRVHKLVYYEFFEQPDVAIAREKQLKAGSRAKKVALIEEMNHDWRDLYDDLLHGKIEIASSLLRRSSQ